jgi:hypothetical protein
MENVAESSHEGTLTIRSFLMGNFSCKTHNYAWLASDIMRSAQPDRVGADWKALKAGSDHIPGGCNILVYILSFDILLRSNG